MRSLVIRKLTWGFLAGTFTFLPLSNLRAQEIDFHLLEQEFNRLVQSCQRYVVSVVARSDNAVMAAGEAGKPVKMVASGFVIDTGGIVVTRSSVLQGMGDVVVVFHDGRELQATLLGLEDQYNFALLAIEPLPFENPYFAQTNSEEVGNWVLVIGNSLGYYPSVSVGRVHKTFPNGIIQVVTKIWPGSVGAPVVNLRGQVIGLLAGAVEPVGGDTPVEIIGEDEAVVIPIAHLLPGIKRIVDNATSGAPWVGMTLTKYPRGNKSVVYRITHLSPNSPAEKAGLRLGDEVVSFNGKPIRDLRELERLIQTSPVSTKIAFRVKRQGRFYDHLVKLERKPPLLAVRKESLSRPSQPDDSGLTRFPENQINQLLYQKRITQIEGELQFLKKTIRKKTPHK